MDSKKLARPESQLQPGLGFHNSIDANNTESAKFMQVLWDFGSSNSEYIYRLVITDGLFKVVSFKLDHAGNPRDGTCVVSFDPTTLPALALVIKTAAQKLGIELEDVQ